jgi:hypothetical protein
LHRQKPLLLKTVVHARERGHCSHKQRRSAEHAPSGKAVIAGRRLLLDVAVR